MTLICPHCGKTFDPRPCKCCGKALVRKRRPCGTLEPKAAWERREYCDRRCKAAAAQAAGRPEDFCGVEGCLCKAFRRSLCRDHYRAERWRERRAARR